MRSNEFGLPGGLAASSDPEGGDQNENPLCTSSRVFKKLGARHGSRGREPQVGKAPKDTNRQVLTLSGLQGPATTIRACKAGASSIRTSLYVSQGRALPGPYNSRMDWMADRYKSCSRFGARGIVL